MVFTLCEPDAALPAKMAFPTLGIHPAEHLGVTGGSPLTDAIGTGPYELKSWEPGVQIRMSRFDGYWGEPSKAESLVFHWWSQAKAEPSETLASGSVDGFVISNENTGTMAATLELNRLAERELDIFYLGLNRDIAPFDNELVREAVATAIDKEAIVAEFFPAGSSVADQFVPSELFGYDNGLSPTGYDQELARTLLTRAGYPGGFETTLTYRNVARPYLPDPAGVAREIRSQLAQVGIFVNVVEMEPSDFLRKADTGQLPMYLLGWEASVPDPSSFLDFHFGADASSQFGARYPDIEEILTEASGMPDQASRKDLFTSAAELISGYLPAVPIAHGGAELAFLPDVEGAHASVLGTERFASMNPGGRDLFSWVQADQPRSLYCADEADRDSFRACSQINEPLMRYAGGGSELAPGLAESYTARADATAWTFHLRQGVLFHDGSELDANDVVATFAAQWDLSSPLHTGRTGQFAYFAILFGGFIDSSRTG